MRVLTICGSTRAASGNALLLRAFARRAPHLTWTAAPPLGELPLFTPEALEAESAGASPSVFTQVAAFRQNLRDADAVLIATPEYAHNLPAALKSALEWVVASGEFSRKRTVALTATPHAPRGERAMQSLVWTLRALDAQVLAEVPVYGVAATVDPETAEVRDAELAEVMDAVVELLAGG